MAWPTLGSRVSFMAFSCCFLWYCHCWIFAGNSATPAVSGSNPVQQFGSSDPGRAAVSKWKGFGPNRSWPLATKANKTFETKQNAWLCCHFRGHFAIVCLFSPNTAVLPPTTNIHSIFRGLVFSSMLGSKLTNLLTFLGQHAQYEYQMHKQLFWATGMTRSHWLLLWI